MTPVRSTPRWLSRLSSLLLILALLSAFVVPAMAQEGVAPLKPLDGVAPLKALTSATCTPLTDQEKVEYDSLAARKADGLSDADYGRLIALGQKADCAAQPTAPTGPEAAADYSFASSIGAYTALTGATTSTATGDDGSQCGIAIGFTFTYDSAAYTTLCVSTNGFVRLAGSMFSSSWTNVLASTTSTLVLAPLWDDLYDDTSSFVYYKTEGSAPNRVFTVEWNKIRWLGSSGTQQNFQVQLVETSNVIRFIYGTMAAPANSPSASIGINDATGGSGHFISVTPAAGTGDTFSTTTANNTISAATNLTSGKTYSFTPPVVVTPPACATSLVPANLATGVAATANLTWASGGGAPTGYKIFFGTDNPPTNIANGTDLGLVTTYDPPGNMAYSTPHYWKIVPYNANGDATGCTVISFTTQVDPTVTVFPYTQNFDGVTAPALPNGWSVVNGATSNSVQWANTNTTNARSATNAMAIGYDFSNAMDDWFFSPPLQLTGGALYQVDFYYRALSSSFTEKLEVKWGTAPSVAGMTGGQIFNNIGFTNATYAAGGGSLTPASSGIYYIGWHGYSAANQDGIYVDDISIAAATTPPSCATGPSPANAATNVNANADLSWSAATGGPTGYKVYFGTVNPPTTMVSDQAGTTYDPGAMPYSTAQYWQIVPYNTYGPATGCPVWSFATEVDPTIGVFPYSQDFNGASFPGWTVENTNSDAYVWGIQTTYRRGITGGAAAIRWNATLAMNDWLFTPPLQLTGGVTYGVRFFFQAAGSTYPEKLEVKWGSAASSAGMTGGQIFNDPAITNTTMKEAIATFSPTTSGIYYVGFHGYSDPDQFYLVVDDVTVYNTADSTWQWQGGASNDWFVNGNWEGAIVPGELDLVEIPVVAEAPNASSPLIGTSVETSYGKVNNLTVNAGATLELASVNNLKVEGTLTNNGWLKQTKFAANASLTEFLRVKNVAGTVDKYSGVDLTPTSSAMGDTVVIVKGNQECPQANAPANTVNRCYEITPTTVAPATTRFYFDSAERGSLVLATLNGWHYNTGTSAFDLLPATANPPGGSGAREYVEATTTTYSPFAVATGNPLAVTLASFGAQGQSDRIVVSWETLSEANNAGFNVYRADDAAGPQTLLASVPSQAPGSTQGFSYTYDDMAVQSGHTYWYWLEDVSLGGATTLHGPVSATVSVPTAVTLASLQATPLAPAVPAATAALAGLAGLMAAAGIAVSRRRAR